MGTISPGATLDLSVLHGGFPLWNSPEGGGK